VANREIVVGSVLGKGLFWRLTTIFWKVQGRSNAILKVCKPSFSLSTAAEISSGGFHFIHQKTCRVGLKELLSNQRDSRQFELAPKGESKWTT